jgi:hypothetical protein
LTFGSRTVTLASSVHLNSKFCEIHSANNLAWAASTWTVV